HANELEVLGESLLDALDHVGDQAAHQPVQGAVAEVVGWALEDELAVLLLDRDLRRQRALEPALRALDRDVSRGQRDLHVARHRDGQLSDPRQLFSFFLYPIYQTWARTSPPGPCRLAWRPLMTPSEVLRMAMPIPPRTLGISVLRA